jgi:hypothetical protein
MDGIVPKLDDPIGGSWGIVLSSEQSSSVGDVRRMDWGELTWRTLTKAPTQFPISRHGKNIVDPLMLKPKLKLSPHNSRQVSSNNSQLDNNATIN